MAEKSTSRRSYDGSGKAAAPGPRAKAALRDGHQIGRDQTARLMRTLQIKGATRMRKVRTTIRDDNAPRSPDLVKRDFTADRPNRLWLTDIT